MHRRMAQLSMILCVVTVTASAQDRSPDSRIPRSGHNLLLDARVSGNLPSFKKGLRGVPEHVIYDLDRRRFLKPTKWHEYGVGYGQNLGVVAEDKAAYWMAEWKAPVEANCIVLTGAYSNQPQPNTAWKIEVRSSGKWQEHDRGVGGWYNQGRYVWGNGKQKPIRFDGLRVSLFSKDKKTPIKSIHFRGKEPESWLVSHSRPTLSTSKPNAITRSPRVSRDLQVLYTFDDGGKVVQDRSGTGQPLNLTIEKPAAVKWQDGALVVRSATKIVSTGPAKKLAQAVKRSGSLTIEAWVRPAKVKQAGPARIVSFSQDSNQRNFTLGQDGDKFDVRLRTTKSSANGIPSLNSSGKTVAPKLTHVVYTRDSAGNAKIYVNGKQNGSKKIAGKLSAWNDKFRLLLANELTGGRPWLGELHLVAIYSRALTSKEVGQNFAAGDATQPVDPALLAQAKHERLFETKIAPLLARSCLECHDSALKEGGLDLSRKTAALAGGEGGKVIVPGKSAESRLWELVEADEMPSEGPLLSAAEKKVLRQWLDNGAVWSGGVIDPATYAHDGSAGENWVQRLTVSEYIATVRNTVGVDIAEEARRILPPDFRADGFSNTAYNLNVDLKHVEAYSRLAEIIVSRMDVLKFSARFSKSRSLNTDATMREFVAAMGKWIFRGPLDKREQINFSGIATTVASSGGSFNEGVGLTIEAMLQSPRFIYRIEDQRGEGAVDQYELASRLSYIIWGGSPDEVLMKAADAGQLSDRGEVESQARRMLKDPRAIKRSLQFISDWLDLDRLANLRPDAKRFPKWDAALASDMRQETLAFFEDIVWKQNRPLADLLNAQVAYVTPHLAKHYGMKPKGDGLSRYDVSTVGSRGGLLTQGSVLTVGGDDASMVTRGLFVLHDVLRGVVKDPPPGLDITPVPSSPGLSQRDIAEKRIAASACTGCHSKFEPLAYGLERFDGLGGYREQDEYGNKLREDGEVLFPGEAKPIQYKTAAELMNLLAGNDRVRESITWKVTQFALGRPLGATDANAIRKIHQAAQKSGGTWASLIAAIVTSDLVMMTRTAES